MAVTLRQAGAEYLALRERQVSPRTYDTERLVITKFIKYANAHFVRTNDMKVNQLKSTHMENFFYDPQRGQSVRVKPSTFNTRRIIMGNFTTFLTRRGYAPGGLMDMVVPRKVVQEEKTRLSPTDLMALVENTKNERDRVFIQIAINTALRLNEITALRVGSVDLESGHLFTVLTKNGKEDYFPINSDLDSALRRWLTYYSRFCGNLEQDMYLVPALTRPAFTTEGQEESVIQPDKPFRWVHRKMRELLATVGVTDKGEGVHTIRRSVATIYYDMALADSDSRDDALLVTQALLNHSTTAVTERYIGKARHKQKRDASLLGKPFLSGMVSGENVVPLRGVK